MLVTQLCPTLWDPMDCSLPVYRHQRTSSSVHGILHARILEWVAISFSRASSWPRDRTRVSCSAVGFFTVEPLGSKNNMGPANIWRGVRKISWRRKWQPTPVLWPGESPRTEEPGVLQSGGLQGVGHEWVAKQQQQHLRDDWKQYLSGCQSLSFACMILNVCLFPCFRY